MQVGREETIAGVRLMKVRDFLRWTGDCSVTCNRFPFLMTSQLRFPTKDCSPRPRASKIKHISIFG
jgi:hypothetical protein